MTVVYVEPTLKLRLLGRDARDARAMRFREFISVIALIQVKPVEIKIGKKNLEERK